MNRVPTHTFKLPSGVECEVKELTGKHQRLLTEQTQKPHGEKLVDMLVDVIVRVGSETTITNEFVNNMLSCDKKAILVEVRQFTLDFEEEFVFTYKYIDRDGNKQEDEMTIPIVKGQFPIKPMLIPSIQKNEDTGEDERVLVPAQFTEYSEVLEAKKVQITLPRSGELVQFEHLDGKGEIIGSSSKKSERSSHTVLKMRKCVRFEKKEKGSIPIQLNYDNLSIKDIEFLRSSIKEVEGGVDTEIQFEHPEADIKPQEEKMVVVDVLGTVAFFFPSEAI